MPLVEAARWKRLLVNVPDVAPEGCGLVKVEEVGDE
jgi:hypothetical protein